MKLAFPFPSPYVLLLSACLGFFLFVATAFIASPGLYYDEVIFAPVSYVIAGQHIAAPIGLKFMGMPITQEPVYVGALKAYVMAPILSLFGSSYLTLRLPMILVGGLCLALLAFFMRKRLPFSAAALVLVLAATDPLFIYATKIDWGPTTLAALFRCLALGFLFRFFDKRRSKDLAVFFAACALGFWDKSNFLWVMVAFAVASLVFYRHVFLGWLHETPRKEVALTLVPFALIYGLIVKQVVLPSLHINMPAHALSFMDYVARVGDVFRLYVESASGQGVFFFIFGSNLPHPSLMPWLVPGCILLGFVVSLPCARFATIPYRRELGFLSLVILLIFIQAVITPQTGGPHHMVVFWPLTPILLVLCGIVIESRFKGDGALAVVGRWAPGVLLVFVCVVSVRADTETLMAMASNNTATLFRPEIGLLSSSIKALGADKVYTIDWGIGNQLVVLADKDDRKKYEDMWPIFSDHTIQQDHPQWLYDRLMGHISRAVFVSFVEDSDNWPQNHLSRDVILKSWNLCSWEKIYVPRSTGQALYRIDLVEPCPVK